MEEFTIAVKGPGIDVSKKVDGQKALQALQLLWGDGGTASFRAAGSAMPHDTVSNHSGLSVGEFLATLRANSNAEKISGIALYLQEHHRQARLKKEEIAEWFTNAGEPPPKNPTRDLQSAISRRLIAEDHARRGEYY